MKNLTVFALFVLLSVGFTQQSVAQDCLSRSGPLVKLSGDFIAPYKVSKLTSNTRIDARLARWVHAENVPFKIGGSPGVCVEGGEIFSNYSLNTSWSIMHDTYAAQIRGGTNYSLNNWRIHNYGDGFFIGKESNNSGFIIKGSYLTQIRDDAFSNDYGFPGTVEDNLVDGAYVAFSDKGYTLSSPSGVMNIKNNLVRLQVYDQTSTAGKAGHGWFWKFDSGAIQISLHGNIFYTEENSIHGSHVLIPSKITSCKKSDGSADNIIVWGGSGAYPRPTELTTGCFSLTTDKNVWVSAVANWKAAHGR